MRARSLIALAAMVVLIVLGGARAAHADAKGDVGAKIKAAMEAYDSFDYDGAKKLLNQALAVAKKAKLDKDPIVAKAYLDLGIVSFAVPDADAAKLSFMQAVQIDPKIQIDVAYKSADLAKLLDQARAEASGGGGSTEPLGGGGGEPAADCSTVKGLEHTIIDTAKAGAPQPIEARVGSDVKAVKVSVMYRVEGATDFTEAKLTKQGDCKYTGAIPASAMKGGMVHYYVAAYNDGAKPIASKGSSGSPNIIEISGVAPKGGGGGDNEDPIGGAKVTGGGGGGGGSVTSNVTVGAHKPKIMVAVQGGTGFGYVTGTTEGMNTVKNCCLGSSLVVLTAELGYMVSPQMSIGAAFRFGVPVGANLDGHATGAPGGLVRVRYALAESGEGLHVMGEIGAGFLRNTIKLDTSMAGMDTDIVAQGPLLVGGGIGFTKKFGSMVALIADLSALAGIAVTDHIGASPLNTGVSADLGIGLAVGF
jgi:hypothetical protein